MRPAFGQTAMAAPTSFNSSARSYTIGWTRPADRAWRQAAAVRPPIPPPMMRRVFIGWDCNVDISSSSSCTKKTATTRRRGIATDKHRRTQTSDARWGFEADFGDWCFVGGAGVRAVVAVGQVCARGWPTALKWARWFVRDEIESV